MCVAGYGSGSAAFRLRFARDGRRHGIAPEAISTAAKAGPPRTWERKTMGNRASRRKKASTVFTFDAPHASKVFLAGDFNSWNPDATPLARARGGRWSVALELPRGRHEYKFVVDGEWACEPGCERGSGKCVPNAFGTKNSVVEVG